MKSGLEIPQYLAQLSTSGGFSLTSTVGMQLNAEMYALHLLVTEDRLDPYNVSAVEHLSRSCLRLMRAVKRNAKAPDFTGMHEYLAHMGDGGNAAHTPALDRHIADLHRDSAQFMKQMRLQKEEEDHESKSKKNKKDKGKGKGEEE